MEQLFDNILKTTIVTSFGICLLLFLKLCLFKRFSKKFNYYIWLIIIFRMLLFPINYSLDFTTEVSRNYLLIDNIPDFIPDNNNLIFYIFFIWVFGIISYLAYLIPKYIKFKNLIVDTSYEIEHDNINHIYNNLLMELNIKKKISLRYSDELVGPAGIGLFSSYIFLPEFPYEEDKIYWILKHELMHFKNKDILIKFLVVFVKAIYWFNPLVYIMSKKIDAECELCCDESVLSNCKFQDKKNYALTLLHAIELSNLNQMGMLTTEFTKTNLEIRLYNITKKKGSSGVIIALLISLIAFTSFAEINAQAPIKNKTDTSSTPHEFGTIDYTYETAPESVRKLYEEKCKKIGKIPKNSDKIELSAEHVQ